MGRIVSACPSGPRIAKVVALVATVAVATIAGSRYLRSGVSPALQRKLAQSDQRGRLLGTLAQLPLTFEPNRGQTDKRVKFLARHSNVTVFLTGDGATLSIHGATAASGAIGNSLNARAALRYIAGHDRAHSDSVSFKFKGANPTPKISGSEKIQTVTNYLVGNDPARWHSSVPNYSRVEYQSIYPGVNVVFYGNHGRLEYDIDVAPGVDPRIIRMQFDDAQGIKLNPAGNLVLSAGDNEIALGQPVAYQETNGTRRTVAANYVLNGPSEVTIALGDYDRSKPLIIDPAIMYSTYLGGTFAQGQAIAVDGAGEAFLSGWTCCVNDFPTSGAYQGSLTGINNAFVAKFSADGKSLIYSTYLGGSNIDVSTGIGVDSSGDAYVTGFTNSSNFPTVPLNDTSLAGGFDAFVAELNPGGNGLIYSRYLGGSQDDIASGIAVDGKGLAYVTGQTLSTDFPTTGTAYQQNNPSGGAIGAGFLARVDPPASSGDASQLFYASYLGGPNPGGNALLTAAAIGGPSGNVYVVGGGGSAVPTTTGRAFGGTFDAIVADFDTTGNGPTSLLFSEFIGGSGFDLGTGIATKLGCTSNCSAFISGDTFSADLGNLGATEALAGLEDAFIAEVDSHGGMNHINYIGGTGFDEASGAAVDSKGDELIAGASFRSADLVGDPLQILQAQPKPLGALFTSSNGGQSFAPSSWPNSKAGSISFGGIAIDKSVSPAIIYIGTNQNGLWESTDGGLTFNQIGLAGAQVPAVGVQTGIGNGPKTAFLAASAGIYISVNGGQSFDKIGVVPIPGPANYYFIGSEEPTTGGTATNFYVFVGTDHGFFVSTNDGAQFTASTGLATGSQQTQVFTGVRDTATTNYYVGTDKGVFVSTDNGTSFTQTNLNNVAVLSLAIDTSTTPSTIYAGTYGEGVVASTDGFNKNLTFAETAPDSNVNYVAIDDTTSNPAIAYVGTGDSRAIGAMWRSKDAGHTYTQLDPANFNQPCCIFPLAVNAGEIFAGNYLEADAFLGEMDPTGVVLMQSATLGGTNHDRAQGVAVDSADNAYVAGLTYSSDYPVVSPEQATIGGGNGEVNAFVTKVGYTSGVKLQVTKAIYFPTQILRTSSKPRVVTVTNTSKTETVALGYIRLSGTNADYFQIVPPVPPANPRVKVTPTCGTTLAPKAKCIVTVVFTPLGMGNASGGLLVPSNSNNKTQGCVFVGKARQRVH
jgi:hypothetical protein